MRDGGKALFPVTHPPSATVTPTSGGRGLITRTWILRLRLQLRAEWQDESSSSKNESFQIRVSNRKKIWCRVDWLGWCSVHRFWIDPVPIGFGMMLWELVMEWRFSCWLLIDVSIGFGLMLCKLVFNWFMSFRKNKVSLFLKFVAAHFIELDSSSNLSTYPPVILHEGLARSCRIHCFNKRKTNSSLWRSCPSVWIKGGGKCSSPSLTHRLRRPHSPGTRWLIAQS